jgi:hypothetical protein
VFGENFVLKGLKKMNLELVFVGILALVSVGLFIYSIRGRQRPFVVVRPKTIDKDLSIKNEGDRPAVNVKFFVNDNVLTSENKKINDVYCIKNGMRSLTTKEEVVLWVGISHKFLNSAVGLKEFKVGCTYADSNGKKYKDFFIIDFEKYPDTLAYMDETGSMRSLVNVLTKIENTLNGIYLKIPAQNKDI